MYAPCRWTYLEAGVEGIMRNLREGVDMTTVSVGTHSYANSSLTVLLSSTWAFTRRRSRSRALHFANDQPELSTTSARHKKLPVDKEVSSEVVSIVEVIYNV